MTDSAIPSAAIDVTTSRRMARQRTRDTKPELLLRSELHQMGLRYRVDAPLPGMPRRRADILFTRAKVAVFVDGCFWHGCPQHKTAPANNGAWWAVKLARNIERDRETADHLTSLGWTVLRIWEHEDMTHVATDIDRVVRSGRASGSMSTPTSLAPDGPLLGKAPPAAPQRARRHRLRRLTAGNDSDIH
jgi:DNA mismatch endonuclease (patch repair protein)